MATNSQKIMSADSLHLQTDMSATPTVTRDMLAMPQEKLKNTGNKY